MPRPSRTEALTTEQRHLALPGNMKWEKAMLGVMVLVKEHMARLSRRQRADLRRGLIRALEMMDDP